MNLSKTWQLLFLFFTRKQEQEAAKRANEEEESLKKQSESIPEDIPRISAPLSETSAFTATEIPEETPSTRSPFVSADDTVGAKESAKINEPIPSTQPAPIPSTTQPVIEDKEGELSTAEKKKLVEALKTMSSDSALSDVRQTLDELKENRQDFKEVVSIKN